MVMTINGHAAIDVFLYGKTPKLLSREKLTFRENRIYKMWKQGMSVMDISLDIGIMAQTVHSSLSHIKNKGWR